MERFESTPRDLRGSTSAGPSVLPASPRPAGAPGAGRAELRRAPGPETHWVVDTLGWVMAPYPFLRVMARRYGDVFRLRMPIRGELVCFSHPDALRQIFLAGADTLQASIGNSMLEQFLGTNSLLLLEGERHMRERRLMIPPFRGERMRHYGALVRECTAGLTRDWHPGRTVRAARFTAEVSLEIIIGAVFGIDRGARHAEYKRALLAAMRTMTGLMVFVPGLHRDLGPWSPGGRKARAFAEVRRLLGEDIARRRAEGDRGRRDILSMLLAARDDRGQLMSDPELYDQLITLLFAGHETTGAALAWALYWIHGTPGVAERLRAELAGLGPSPDPDAASRLPYLDAVCKESLRISPVVPAAARGVVAPVDIHGYRLRPGQRVLAAIYLAHHRDDIYPEPDRFRPERFLERKPSPYEYLPFGGGVRRCLGMAFALYEMKIVLATLLARFDLELASRLPVMGARRSVTVAPSGGPRLRVRGRRG